MKPLENPFTRVDPRVYNAGRPPYAPAVQDHLRGVFLATFGRLPIPRAVDVGAGTGLFTRLLTPLCDTVIAADPVADALTFAEAPGVETLCSPAESLPLPDASADVVTCGNAFHWTKRPLALREMARILRPGGVLVIAWNLPIGFHRGPFEPIGKRILHYNPTWVTDRVEQLTGWDDLQAHAELETVSRVEWPQVFMWTALEVLEFYKSTSFAGGDVPAGVRPELWAEMAALLETIANPTVPCHFLSRLEIARKKPPETIES
jgi:SAM-dependent methyltransferase